METLTPAPESRFTGPTVWCPNPGRWSSTDEDSTEIEVSELLAGFVRALQPDLCVETGAAWGQTTEAIGRALAANGTGLLVSLEPDPQRLVYSTGRCQGLPVRVMGLASLDWTPDGTIGFAFFDSLFPLRIAEFRHYCPWMRQGTIVAFHDSAPGHGGGQFPFGRDLRTEIERELADEIRLIHLPTPRGITIGEVR